MADTAGEDRTDENIERFTLVWLKTKTWGGWGHFRKGTCGEAES